MLPLYEFSLDFAVYLVYISFLTSTLPVYLLIVFAYYLLVLPLLYVFACCVGVLIPYMLCIYLFAWNKVG